MPITDRTARGVVDTATKRGRQVAVTLRPALDRAHAELTQAQADLATAQAAYDDAVKPPAIVWTGTAQFDPTRGGHVTLTGAVRTGGDTVTAKEPTSVMIGLGEITAITQADYPADPDLAGRVHRESGGPVIDPRWPGSRGAQ